MEEPTGYVASSAVRSQTLEVVADDPPVETVVVLDAADASQSAVYEALAGLDDEGHIESVDAGWVPTASGRAVADVLALCERADAALLAAPDYWSNHRLDAVPERFRQRLGALEAAEIRRAPDTDPGQVVRDVAAHIRDAERVDVLAPVYHREYGDALQSEPENGRVVIDPTVATEVDDVQRRSADETAFEVRIAPVDVGLAVSEDALYLSLPRLDGGYDAQSELVATDPAAVAWGRQFFEARWGAAEPIERFTRS